MKNKTAIRAIAMTAAALILVCILLMFAGCATAENASESSTKAEYAIVRLPDGTLIEGNVDRKYSYSNGCIDITIDGVAYKTHWANVATIESSK